MNDKRIVVVEDQPIVAAYIKSVLEDIGYKIIGVFSNGQDVIDFCNTTTPDLLLLDVMLEGTMTGIDVATALKDKELAIIFISALSDEVTLKNAIHTNPYGYVIKPFDETDLVNRVSFAIQKLEYDKKIERERLKYIIEGQENEKVRISKELHDGMGQVLNRLKLELEIIDPSEPIIKKEALIQLTQNATDQMRNMISDLMPMHIIDFKLSDSIDKLCMDSSTSECNIIFDSSCQELEVSYNIKFAIFRILQELITNSFKHGKASEINVQLHEQNNWLELSYEDNGGGFSISEKPQGRGLLNVRDRLKILNGDLHIESKKNKGVFFSINNPIA